MKLNYVCLGTRDGLQNSAEVQVFVYLALATKYNQQTYPHTPTTKGLGGGGRAKRRGACTQGMSCAYAAVEAQVSKLPEQIFDH